jgi:hypothetical protein
MGSLLLHLLGAYRFHLSLNNLRAKLPRMIALYTLIPFGNIICVVHLSKSVNAKMKEIGVTRGINFAGVKAIEAETLENQR